MALSFDSSIQNTAKRRPLNKGKTISIDNLAFIIQISFPLLIIFGIYSAAAWMNSRTNSMLKKKDAILNEIKGLEREIENLKLKIENARGQNIHLQISKFNLQLRSPKWGQQKELEIPGKSDEKTPGKNLASARIKRGG